MTAVLSQTQVAEKSILDLAGRQTYLGNCFVGGFPTAVVGATTETPILLFKNPAANTKSAFVYLRRYDVQVNGNGICAFQYYTAPTITADGTAVTPMNMRINSSASSSSMQLFKFPTLSANGTPMIHSFGISPGPTTEEGTLAILDPGMTVALTATSSSAVAPVSVQLFWYEI